MPSQKKSLAHLPREAHPIDTLVNISRHYGADPQFVIAGGGNTSMKTAERLYIKASGHALATINSGGFVEMDRQALEAILNTELPENPTEREALFLEKSLAARINAASGLRPSVELVLHHLISERFVVHSHATLANAITCCQNGQKIAADIFGDEILWVPYVDPGYTLARTLQQLLQQYQKRTGRSGPTAILMQNHGLLVSGETAEQIRKRTDSVLSRIARRLDAVIAKGAPCAIKLAPENLKRQLIETIAPALRVLLSDHDRPAIVTFDDSSVIQCLVGTVSGRAAAIRGPLTPDQIVYCKSFPLLIKPPAIVTPENVLKTLEGALTKYRSKTGQSPKIVLVEGVGLFAAGQNPSQAHTARDVYCDAAAIMKGAESLGGVRHLRKSEYEFIERWESESYRQKVSMNGAKAGRVAGKVVLVTGAAQGVGQAIAEDLARQGACVALVDLNPDGVKRLAEELNARHGQGRALPLVANVSDEGSVADSVHQTVRVFGGLDVLVSNAGVLKADSVKTLPVKDFKFVTDVNYLGYFLYVKAVAPVMSMQHRVCPSAWTDIIQINSKSGLAGSNRNAAYAGSKFGGIGLTQSFALELVDDGIKVNSICPGNFFDGPLWSDPKNGLFAQYLRAGKVPGARTITDVKKAYEQKVPMGRGCAVADLMKAIYYVVDQAYETGQAIPVTGGQIMLS